MNKLLRWPSIWALMLVSVIGTTIANAQCIQTSSFGSATVDQNTPANTTISTCSYTTEYSTITVNFPGIYTFSVSASPGYVTITDALNNVIGHGPSPYAASIAGTGTYRAHWSDNSTCGGTTSCFVTAVGFTSFLGNCIPPLGITASGITANAATINWAASTSAPANGYEYVINSTGVPPTGSGTATTATTFPATGLNPSTSYYVYVRAMCGPDTSIWNSTSFLTACSTLSAPWTENFDGAGWAPTTTTNPCWTFTPTSGYRWQLDNNNTGSSSTGPSADHTTGIPGSGNYIYTEASSGLAGSVATFSTPPTDLTGLANPALYFWKHFYGADIDSFFVEVDNGSGFQVIYSSQGDGPQTDELDPWTDEILDLNAFAGQTITVQFRAKRGPSFAGDMAIDDVKIDVGPACFRPSSISLVNVGVTDMTVDWIPSSGTNWEVAYGAPGFSPDSAVGSPSGPIAVLPATAHPFQITGLTANTDYSVYVREACTATPGTWSAWRGTVNTRTNCSVYAAPFYEGFDSAQWVPSFGASSAIDACWDRTGTTGHYWMPEDDNTDFDNGPSSDRSGTGLFMNAIGGAAGDVADLTTPLVDLNGLTNPAVGFYFFFYGSEIGTMYIQANGGSGWTTLDSLSGNYQNSETDPWLYYEVPLSTYANDTVQIRFSSKRGSLCCNYDIAIDEVFIGEGSPCALPSFPTVVAGSDTSLNVSWTDPNAAAWNVTWGPVGFSPDSAVGSSNGPIGSSLAFTPSFIINGLAGNTTYQVYVNAFCSTGGVSFGLGQQVLLPCAV